MYKNLQTILKRFNIDDTEVSRVFFHSNAEYFRSNIDLYCPQSGGNITTDKYTFNKYTFTIYKDSTNRRTDFFINVDDDLNNPQSCMFITIAKNSDIVHINNISYHEGCAKVGLKREDGGSILLKLTLKFIDDIKKHYKLKYIILLDNSNKWCDERAISLPKMFTMLHGVTWYGKYGFRPYVYGNDKATKMLERVYSKNEKIVNRLKLKDMPKLREYIKDAYDEIKPKNLHLDRLLNVYDKFVVEDRLVSDYLKIFLGRFDKTCVLFERFYESLYKKMGLFDFHGRSFIKNFDRNMSLKISLFIYIDELQRQIFEI